MSKRTADRKARKKLEKLKEAKKRDELRAKVHSYLVAFKREERLDRSLLTRLSKEPPSVLDAVFSPVIPAWTVCHRILARPFPKNYAQLGSTRREPGLVAAEPALTLVYYVLRYYSAQVNEFIVANEQLLDAIISGRISDARSTLDDFVRTHGVSLWSIEASLLIGEQESGVRGNRATLSIINEQLNNAYISFLTSFITQRIESCLSVPAYESALFSAWTEEDAQEETVGQIISDVIFRLGLHRFDRPQHFGAIVDFARDYSVFDVYQTFLRTLEWCACRDGQVGHKVLETLVSDATSLFQDSRLCVLKQFLSPSSLLEAEPLQDELFSLADAYTRGAYSDVCGAAIQLIEHFPTSFELYEFAARAAVNGQVELRLPFSESSLGSVVLQSIHQVLARTSQTDAALMTLLKQAYALDGTSFGQRIMTFWLQHKNVQTPMGREKLFAVSSSRATPWFATGLPDATMREGFLRSCDKAYPANTATAVFRYTHDSNPRNMTELPTALPDHRRLKYDAIRYEHLSQDESAIRHYNELRRQARGRMTIQHAASCGLVRSYRRQGQPALAATIIVEAFLENDQLLHGELQQHVTDIVEVIEDHGPDRTDDLTWSVFLHIAFEWSAIERRYYKLFVACDSFLKNAGVTRPSELCLRNSTPDALFLAFLRYVCILEVLRDSYHFSSTQQLEDERLRVLQYLLVHDAANTSLYTTEIAELTTRNMLRTAVEQVDSSRIYVDIDGIRRSLSGDHAEKFERYTRILVLEDEHWRKQLKRYDFVKRILSFEDLAFTLFKELLFEVRDLFVSSKPDGLDTYLSMRIRHGHLSGQLRGQFEQLHLVTRRVGDGGGYAPIDRHLDNGNVSYSGS